ncbi:adenosylcobinamide amidohydrolase [Sporosarcina sp. D27]|uniref:adenosylcobinamide amidohydrolase n=1 Tax=Sporosarcina sp. D27 TaxID=1382305 RepID=UPI00047176CA|nr:adenosylcobinamide amidohydrolase [Sporosarcina sp. D27]
MLHVQGITGGYGKEPIVKNVSFDVQPGEILGILGPNGSGKSTLLKMISGILPNQAGTVKIADKDADSYSPKEFARNVAVLPQMHAHAFSHTVKATVELGRYPYQTGLFSSWTAEDETAVNHAMERTGVARYANTLIESLSGGEQQRVFVAQALAQQAPLLLLDEPTNHLDIAYQQQLLDTVRSLAVDEGKTIVSVFHDINLAALYCDRLLLMENGEIAKIGLPQDVVRETIIQSVYKAAVKTQAHPELPKPQMTLLPSMNGSVEESLVVDETQFTVTADSVQFHAYQSLKTVSSAVHNPGTGWYTTFVNRHVDANYDCDDVKKEMEDYLEKRGHHLTDTVGMMTAVQTLHAEIASFADKGISIVIAVTAGVGNAVDVSKAREREANVGTINTWIIVNGRLSDEAFIQAMITATEAKTRALQTEKVLDPLTGTQATGTSTDSLLVAATQIGPELPYAGPITPLGKLIGTGVYECTIRAIQTYKEAKGWKS